MRNPKGYPIAETNHYLFIYLFLFIYFQRLDTLNYIIYKFYLYSNTSFLNKTATLWISIEKSVGFSNLLFRYNIELIYIPDWLQPDDWMAFQELKT